MKKCYSNIEKEIYSYRSYVLNKYYSNNRIKVLYYFLKYKYYEKMNTANFIKH